MTSKWKSMFPNVDCTNSIENVLCLDLKNFNLIDLDGTDFYYKAIDISGKASCYGKYEGKRYIIMSQENWKKFYSITGCFRREAFKKFLIKELPSPECFT